MRILILGGGGREHAFAWKISQSERCEKLFIAPGNPGTTQCGTNVALDILDFEALWAFVQAEHIEMVVVGPEEPLVRGVVDYLKEKSATLMVIGPDQLGATLEGSKAFAKKFMMENNIPTAAYQEFVTGQLQEAGVFLRTLQPPYVLKADGLAAGKGVVILDDLDAAEKELDEMLSGKFGTASKRVVIEEFLSGIEFSVFVLTDGQSYKILPEAKDYKRIGEGDTGLNTGGMGAVSPVPFVDEVMMQKVEERIVKPTIGGLHKRGMDYRGFVFVGLISVNGEPMVIEYNCRMGDPETEVVLPRLACDLVDLLEHTAQKTLEKAVLETDPRAAATVMLVSGGYPEDYEKGIAMSGWEATPESIAFHAGTRLDENEVLRTNGGRVMAITSFGQSLSDALAKSYKNAEKIAYKGCYYRRDIGQDVLKKQ